jgi:hypothetical protein
MICGIYCLVYFVKLLQKTVALGFQFNFVSSDGSLSIIQRLDFVTG